MRLTYYGYYLNSLSDNKDYLVDLADFADDFVHHGDPTLQKSISYAGDSLYLLPFGKSVYLFLQSRDRELIKAIEDATLTVDDIKKKIGQSRVGFASYVYFGQHYLGIASRILSPRITALSSLMTQLLHSAGGTNYIFTPRLFTTTVPKSAAIKFKQVGAISIEMDTSNSIAKDVLTTVTGIANPSLANIASLEVRIVPIKKGKKSLDKELVGITKTVPDEGLEGIEARAKLELSDHMTDYYIHGCGGVRELVSFENESALSTKIPDLAAEAKNQLVARKVKEFRNDPSIKKGCNLSDLGIDRKRITASTPLVAKSSPRNNKPSGNRRSKNHRRAKGQSG